MRNVTRITWIAFAGVSLTIPLSGVDYQKGRPVPRIVEAQTKEVSGAVGAFVYKPPEVGAPGGRVGGGTRGPGGDLPVLSVLAPDHTGLTAQDQPSLFWYVSNQTAHPVELTIIDDQTVQPLLALRIDVPVQPGVRHVRLSEHDIHFMLGKQYKWFVALVVDPDRRSKDVVAGGAIERVELPQALREKLAQAEKAEVPYLYAEAGFWYDALAAISDLIDAAPDDPVLRKQRASLLEQVDLPEIAEYDRRQSSAN